MPSDLVWRAALDASDLKSGLASLAQAGASAMGSVQQASEGAAAAVEKVGAPAAMSAAAMQRLERQAQALRASVDPLAAAQVRFAQETAKANRLLELGAIDAGLHARAMTSAKDKLEEATKAFGGHTGAMTVNRAQMMELSHVARSMIDSIVAGANPLRVMAQESGRVGQILGEGEGGMAGSMAVVQRFMTPLNVALLAGAAAAAGLGAATLKAATSEAELGNALVGIGAASGANIGELNRIADATAAAGEGSVGFAKEAEAAFLRAGVQSGNLEKAVGVVERFAAMSGEKAPEALKQLAEAMQDPAKGAETLGAGVLNLSAEQIRNIQILDEQGRHYDAQTAMIDAVAAATDRARSHLTDFGQGFAELSGHIAGAIDKLGQFLLASVKVPAAQRLAQLEAEKAQAGTVGGFAAGAGRSVAAGVAGAIPLVGPLIGGALGHTSTDAERDAEIARLRSEIAGKAAYGRQQGDNAESRRQRAVVDSLDPMATQIRKYTAEIDAAREALRHPVAGGPSANELNLAIKKGQEHIDRLQRRWDPRPKRERKGPKGPADTTESEDSTATRDEDAADKDLADAQKAAAAAARKLVDSYTIAGRLQAAQDEAEATRQAAHGSIDADLQKKLDDIADQELKVRDAKNDAHQKEQLATLAAARATEMQAASIKRSTADAEAAYARQKAARDADVEALQEQIKERKMLQGHSDAIDQITAAMAPAGQAKWAAEEKVLANQERDARQDVNDRYNLQEEGISTKSDDGAAQIAKLEAQRQTEMASLEAELTARRQQFAVGQMNPLAADAYQERQTDPMQTAETDAAESLRGFGARIVEAGLQGKNFGDVIQTTARGFVTKLLGDTFDKAVTGPLEGWLSSLLPQTAMTASAASSTTAMSLAATTATGALSALALAANAAAMAQGAGGGGGFGSFFGDIFGAGASEGVDAGSLASVGAADAVPFFRDGGRIPGFAGGSRAFTGRISGPGIGTSDSILAMVDGRHPIAVSHGETIMTAAASQRFGHVLEQMNRGALRGYADGGVIGASAGPVSSGGGGGDVHIHDHRTTADPPPKVTRGSDGSTTINLEKLSKDMIRGNPEAVRDAAMSAPQKVIRRGA